MSDSAYLDQAALWSKDLTRLRARGSDTESAMRSVGRDCGVDYHFLWMLRYRRERLKIMSISVYESLRAAYLAECAAQMRKLEDDIARTEKITGPDHHSVVSAKAVVGSEE